MLQNIFAVYHTLTMSTLSKTSRGFTLIELLVVIAIIGILSSVILASLSAARMKSRDARRISDLHQLQIALAMYFDANGYYPGVYAVTPSGTDATGAACTAVPCWDLNGYSFSGNTSWTVKFAADLKPYLTTLPTDPVGNGMPPWAVGGHTYYYGNVGRFGKNMTNSTITMPNTYDLVANFETPSHPQSCKFTGGTFGKGAGINLPLGLGWCSSSVPAGSYSDSIYALNPS